MLNPLQKTLGHPKLIVPADLAILKARLDDQIDLSLIDDDEELMVVLHCESGYPLSIHRVIYDRFLAPLGGPPQEQYSILCGHVAARRDHLIAFVIYLYLRHLNEIDEEGRMVGLYRLADPCYIITQHIVELAHYYHLTWLQALCRDVISYPESQDQMIVGPVIKRGDELFIAGAKKMMAIGAPLHTKTLTASADGHTWYALSAPKPGLIEVWLRRYKTNHWRLLTSVLDQQAQGAQTYQLTLAETTLLYVLLDGVHLRCFNTDSQKWHRVNFGANTSMTYVLTETGDQSLPATLTANNQNGTVTIVNSQRAAWLDEEEEEEEKDYTHDTLTTRDNTLKFWMPNIDPLGQLQKRLYEIVGRCPLKLKKKRNPPLVVGDQPCPLKKVKATTLEEGLTALKDSGRPTNPEEFIRSNVQARLDLMNRHYEEAQTPAQIFWRRVTVVRNCLYGQKEDGRWYQNQIEVGVYRHVNGWSLIPDFGPKAQVVWNPLLNTVSTVKFDPTTNGLNLDDFEVEVNLFNPNYTDHALLTTLDTHGFMCYTPSCYNDWTVPNKSMSGLDSLYNSQKIKDPKTGQVNYLFDPDQTPPLALNLLLEELEGPRKASIKNSPSMCVTYPNGGIKKSQFTHPETDEDVYELYTLRPFTTHSVQGPNLQRLLKPPLEPAFAGFVGCAFETHRPTGYIYGKIQDRRCHYPSERAVRAVV
nr:ORF103 [Acipenserid herpesvirus 1]